MWERIRAQVAGFLAPTSPVEVNSTTKLTARGGLGTIADFVAVGSALSSTWALVHKGALSQTILAMTLGLLALAFMGLSFHLQREQAKEAESERRRARHAQSLTHLSDSLAALRTGSTLMSWGEHPSAFTQFAREAVDAMAAAMSTATGRKCRVIVKTIFAPGGREDVAVKTFTSSEVVVSRRDPSTTGSLDWVKENTDFDEIFYQSKEYFLSNNLEHERGYKNSHFTPQSLSAGYPYLSTIVWPIYGPEDGGTGGWHILGFLCVDTKEADSFDESLDVVVGQALAPVWYMALQRYDEASEVQQ